MRVAPEYEVRWVNLRQGFKKPQKRLALLHMPCKKQGIGACLQSARRCRRCYLCHRRVEQEVLDRACFMAAVQGHSLFGFEMRQANLLRWWKADNRRRPLGIQD